MTVPDSVPATPWRTIWRSPRATYRGLLASPHLLQPILLSAAGGTAQAFARGTSHDIGIRAPLWMILTLVPLGGSLIGVVQMLLASALFLLTGRLINVPASFRSLQVVIGWANIPFVISVLLWILASLVVGRHLFVADPTAIQYSSAVREFTAAIGSIIVSVGFLVSTIWALCLLVSGLTVANNYSVAMGILHLIGVLVIVAGAALLFLIPLIALARG